MCMCVCMYAFARCIYRWWRYSRRALVRGAPSPPLSTCFRVCMQQQVWQPSRQKCYCLLQPAVLVPYCFLRCWSLTTPCCSLRCWSLSTCYCLLLLCRSFMVARSDAPPRACYCQRQRIRRRKPESLPAHMLAATKPEPLSSYPVPGPDYDPSHGAHPG